MVIIKTTVLTLQYNAAPIQGYGMGEDDAVEKDRPDVITADQIVSVLNFHHEGS